jgi:UDP-2,3-diacylglucosamine hydrolase
VNTPKAVPRFVALNAPAHWRTVDFISDLHLQSREPATFQAWQHYMQTTPADAVFILGDLFDVWVGDDSARASLSAKACALNFEEECALVLQQSAKRLALFFMHGNRDFLIGPQFMSLCQTTLLDDPTVLAFADQRWLLSHGDALCLEDRAYMQFRQQVRSNDWQQNFLEKPLAERQTIAQELRRQSQLQHQVRQQTGEDFFDVDNAAARQWLQAAGASTLIHGHTHRPAHHDLADGLRRVVLSDWDAAALPARIEVLRLNVSGLQRISLTGV